MDKSCNTGPSLRNLTNKEYRNPLKTQWQILQEVGKPHIDSFNYMLREGLIQAVRSIPPLEFQLPNGQKVALSVQDAVVGVPTIDSGNQYASQLKVFPNECRERGSTYRGPVTANILYTVDGRKYSPIETCVGHIPIMVKSSVCNLNKLSPEELIKHGEEESEWGGYFIINGNEKIIRMLIMPRRNYPLALSRGSWKNRGPHYTEFGIQMRCVAQDLTSVNMVLHYLTTGAANLSLTYKKEQFFIPIIMVLKALVDVPDKYIFEELIKGKEENSFYKGCVANMLRQLQMDGFYKQKDILKFIGSKFRIKTLLPEWKTDREVAEFLFSQCVCIHLDTNIKKFHMLVYMTRKLFAFAKGECAAESADNPMFQEVLLGGYLYQLVIKEKIENYLLSIRFTLERNAKSKGPEFTVNKDSMTKALQKCPSISRALEYLMATGNLVSKTGLGLMQNSGLTVVADKLNFFRYLSHFRCIHRGAFFAEMRTTSVRKLLPEAWGFLCPVHTPDGAPCGLMNHMTALCQIVNTPYKTDGLCKTLFELGVTLYDDSLSSPAAEYYPVMLDGRMFGWLHKDLAREVSQELRCLKVKNMEQVPQKLEICLVEQTSVPSQYPGLYLFTSMARMVRPVKNLCYSDKIEYIGTFEQVYLDICVNQNEAVEWVTTHEELSETSMLSMVASLTPFSDFNQSPRNMYQCQMGKQTMGTPCHALSHRADNKLYRIQTPQSPLVRPQVYDDMRVDEYPLGTNAVVAVISYTGYDMEDAMIINKSSLERGFGHGSVYKAQVIDLNKMGGKNTHIFGNLENGVVKCEQLDPDGLPAVGTYLQDGDPFYSTLNITTGEVKVKRYVSLEPAYVDRVSILGDDLGKGVMTRVSVILRVNRNPIIGDKFSSRHGQKGIMSKKWPVEDLPFSESGMQPDILFNPHGFPSRMTIGMMIESMAGKAAAMHATCYDATPFTFSEDDSAIDYFGKLLTKAGYSYFGTERLYSGVDGREFEADIFTGVVYYQRLRHMVSDKFQVRTTGSVDSVTKQPLKGRKKGGGIRFGEMERDALLSHGTSFLLQDRLFNCSDRSVADVCRTCGSILSPLLEAPVTDDAAMLSSKQRALTCGVCRENSDIVRVAVPHVFRYMCAEMAAMNIKLDLNVQQR